MPETPKVSWLVGGNIKRQLVELGAESLLFVVKAEQAALTASLQRCRGSVLGRRELDF